MSVINNVLKDLESRESHFTPIEISTVDVTPAAARDMKPFVLVALLLILGAAGAWYYLQSPRGMVAPLLQPTGSTPANEPVAVAVSRPAIADSAPVESIAQPPAAAEPTVALVGDDADVAISAVNQIVGLQIRESEQEMRMEFVMREKVVAYLQERGENSFGYHLRDIENRIAAPRISDNPWIRTLAIDSDENGVDIRFETAADILVETRQTNIDGEPVWAINLRKAIVSPPVTGATDEPVIAADEKAFVAETGGLAATGIAAVSPSIEAPVPAPAAEVKLEIKTTNPDARLANQLEYASRLMSSGRHTDAENLLRQLLGGAEDYQARRLLLAFYQGRQLRERFNRLARESAAKYPEDAAFRTEYARALFQGADYHAVIGLLTAQPSLDAKQQALLAASYQRLDQHDSAIRHYRLALREDSGNAKNWIGLAVSQEHGAELEAALESYRRAGRIGQLSERLRAFVEQRSDTLRQVLN